MRPILLFCFFLIGGQLIAQSITLNSGTPRVQINQDSIFVAGNYTLANTDTTQPLKYKTNKTKAVPIENITIIDSTSGQFNLKIENPWLSSSDDTYIFSVFLREDESIKEEIVVKIKKSKPIIISQQLGTYLSTTRSSMGLSFEFNDTLQADKGSLKISNASGDSLRLSTSSLNFSNTTVYVTIEESNFTGINRHNWEGTTTLTIRDFEDTYGNVMDETVLDPGPVVDLKIPEVQNAVPSLTLVNLQTETLKINAKFSEIIDTGTGHLEISTAETTMTEDIHLDTQTDTIEHIINKSKFANLQGEWRLTLSDFVDLHGNLINDYTLAERVLVDTEAPEKPKISQLNHQIVNSEKFQLRGTKEANARVLVDGKEAEGQTSGTEWNLTYNLPEEKLYEIEIWQEDAAGNSSELQRFFVEADRTAPQPGIAPPALIRKLDPDSGSDIWELDVYFSERVQRAQGTLTLSSQTESISLAQTAVEEYGSVQKLTINDAGIVEKIDNAVTRGEKLSVSIPLGAFIDRAGNENSELSKLEVNVFKENFIDKVSGPKYNSSSDSSIIVLEIQLRPEPTSKFLLSLNVLNMEGESVFGNPSTYNVVSFAEQDSVSLGDKQGQLVFNTVDNMIRWKLPLVNYRPGSYKASISAQEKDLNLAVIPVEFTFYIVNRVPEIIAISPAATPAGHYINRDPEFVVELGPDSSGVPVSSVKIWFEDEPDGQNMIELSESVWTYNCKDYGIKLNLGENIVRFEVTNDANLKTKREYTYYVSDAALTGIKDFFNYPNPFNPQAGQRTIITAAYASKDDLKLYIFDLSGRLVYYRERTNDDPGIGNIRQDFRWDGTDLSGSPVPNGVYLARLKSRKYESKILKIVVNNHK